MAEDPSGTSGADYAVAHDDLTADDGHHDAGGRLPGPGAGGPVGDGDFGRVGAVAAGTIGGGGRGRGFLACGYGLQPHLQDSVITDFAFDPSDAQMYDASPEPAPESVLGLDDRPDPLLIETAPDPILDLNVDRADMHARALPPLIGRDDVNHDGTIDRIRVDLDRDGVDDLYLRDYNDDGKVDYAVFDHDGDGVTDEMWSDNDNDGRVERVDLDTDGDHLVDTVLLDTDGDDVLDTRQVDADENGSIDSRVDIHDGDRRLPNYGSF